MELFEEKKLFVKIGPVGVEEMLRRIFKGFNITNIKSKYNYAIVEFSTRENAVSALHDIRNKPGLNLRLSMARNKSYYDSRPGGNPKELRYEKLRPPNIPCQMSCASFVSNERRMELPYVPEFLSRVRDRLRLLSEQQSVEQSSEISIEYSLGTTPTRSEDCILTPGSNISEGIIPQGNESEHTSTSRKCGTMNVSWNYTAWFSPPNASIELRMIQKGEKGMVCLAMDTKNEDMKTKYNLLAKEFHINCAASKNNKFFRQDGLMAVEVREGLWFRAVRCSSGWALLDRGVVVPLDKVLLAIPCPYKYKNFPKFTCYLICDSEHQMENLDTNLKYCFEVKNRNYPDKTLYVKIYREDGVTINGQIRQWEMTIKTQDNVPVSLPKVLNNNYLDLSEMCSEHIQNTIIKSTVKVSSLTKLDIQEGSQVVVVNHVGSKIYLRQSGENAVRAYLELLDKLILYGPKLSTVTYMPEQNDLVICKYGNCYQRAEVKKYCLATNKCDVTFLDIGQNDTVCCTSIKVVPVCAVEVPIMVDSFILAGVQREIMSNDTTTGYLSSLMDAETTLKCIDLTQNQIVLEIQNTEKNVNDKIIDLFLNSNIIKTDEGLEEPFGMKQNIQFIDLQKGQHIKMLHVLNKYICINVVNYNLESKLKELTKKFSEYCNSVQEHYKPKKDAICFYENKRDATWCRGCVLQIDDNGIVEIVSLDYGVLTYVHYSNCRKMKRQFLTALPYLAVYVCLTEIGPKPSNEVLDKTWDVLNDMSHIKIESAICDGPNLYRIQIEGLAARLEDEGIL